MSDQVTIGDYSLEISGDEVLVRDENGAVVEEVKLDDVQGELTLPDGQKVDLAAIFADSGIDALQTAAGAANDNVGFINGGPATFQAFHGADAELGGFRAAGPLDGTSLANGSSGDAQPHTDAPSDNPSSRASFGWARHRPGHPAPGGLSDHASDGQGQSGGNEDVVGGQDNPIFPPSNDHTPPASGAPSEDRFTPANDARWPSEVDQQDDSFTAPADERPEDEQQDEGSPTPPTDEQRQPEDEQQDQDSFTPPSDEQQQEDEQQDQGPFTPPVDEQQQQSEDEQQDQGPFTPPTDEQQQEDEQQDQGSFTPRADEQQQQPDDERQDQGSFMPPTDEQRPEDDQQGQGSLTPPTDEQQPPEDGQRDQGAFTPPADEQQQQPDDEQQDQGPFTPPADEQQQQPDDERQDQGSSTPPTDEQQQPEDQGNPPVEGSQPLAAINAAPTDIALSSGNVVENIAGAIIGALTVVDPDAGDTHSFAVSDDRFEIVEGQLKLKDGISLDFESEPTIDVLVTATDSFGNQLSESFTLSVGDVNETQTGMSLNNSSVAENAAGAVIGTLSVSDPDAGDNQSFKVSDDRFEVVNDQLKLKSGISLDHEQASSVSVTVTATDSANHQYAKSLAIAVTDVNEVPTAIQLSSLVVNENAAGATIGKLTTTDPDAGDAFSYQLSDNRFQVVDGQLQLKSGISLDHEAEPTVNLKVTSTDSAGHSIQQSFTVNVANVNEAPVVTVKNGWFENHAINTSMAYNPVASSTVGAYLYSNDGAGIKVPASNLLNGVDSSNLTLSAAVPVTVTFQKEAAGNHNMIGTYQYDSNGNIIPGSAKFVWLDASANSEGQLGAGMVKDFLGYKQSNTVSLGTMPAGAHVGFFAISNGASDGANKTLLTNAAAGANSQAAAMAAIAGQLSIKVDANGNGHVYLGNSQMNGDVFFTHNKALNTDFTGSGDIDHFASGVSSSLAHQLLIGLEDLKGGGDKDFNDVVFSVDLGTADLSKTSQSAVQPTVDFSDVDSNTLSQAVIHTSGFQAGDTLNIPPSGSFNVTIDHSAADYTITIVGKTGMETVDQYETFANSISFSTTSQVEGGRHIDYSITDGGGLKSNAASADITVNDLYEISTSTLGKGQTTLGSGDDVLHINTDSFSPVRMGDGYDTVHLAQQGRSFDHQDAVKLEGVEAIDTTGYGANSVSLSINDVLDMTDSDNHLTIIGDKGDTVTLTGNGNNHWTVAGSTPEFTTYVYNDPSHQAVVEISNQLNTQVS